jgi:hypothetical protein
MVPNRVSRPLSITACCAAGRPIRLDPEWVYDEMGSLASFMRHVDAQPPTVFHCALNRLQLTLRSIEKREGEAAD